MNECRRTARGDRVERRILVVQTAFLGDAVLTLPLIQAIKTRFPKADLHLFVRAGLEERLVYISGARILLTAVFLLVCAMVYVAYRKRKGKTI